MNPIFADQVREWLLHSAIQIATGDESGGITGWLNAEEEPEYVYMEITGYYLSCMAFIITEHPNSASLAIQRAEGALHWLKRQIEASGPLQTRRFLKPTPQDWRNEAEFAFDIGMVVRGLYAIYQAQPDNPLTLDLLKAYTERLLKLRNADHSLKSHQLLDPTAELPYKWSTRPDAHHLKIVSVLATLPEHILPRAEAMAVVDKVYDAWRDSLTGPTTIELDLHPTCYFLEGMLQLAMLNYPDNALEVVRTVFLKLINHLSPEGTLPSNLVLPDAVIRSDVLAQTLRVGSILRDLGCLDATHADWEPKLAQLYASLRRFVGPQGAMSFFPLDGQHKLFWNVWCSMFAYQAMALYEGRLSRAQLESLQLGWLI